MSRSVIEDQLLTEVVTGLPLPDMALEAVVAASHCRRVGTPDQQVGSW